MCLHCHYLLFTIRRCCCKSRDILGDFLLRYTSSAQAEVPKHLDASIEEGGGGIEAKGGGVGAKQDEGGSRMTIISSILDSGRGLSQP